MAAALHFCPPPASIRHMGKGRGRSTNRYLLFTSDASPGLIKRIDCHCENGHTIPVDKLLVLERKGTRRHVVRS